MSEGQKNHRPKTIRRNLKPKPQSGKNKTPSITENTGLSVIQFPQPPNKRKIFRSSKSNKRKAEKKYGEQELKEFFEEEDNQGLVISINSKQDDSNEERNLLFYFRNTHLMKGRKRYIDICGGFNPDTKQCEIDAFDLKLGRKVSILEDVWYEKKLYQAELSEKKFKSLIKRRRAFNNKK